jgi:hypothetical protein
MTLLIQEDGGAYGIEEGKSIARRNKVGHMSNKQHYGEQEHVPATRRHKPIPLRMARGPQDYLPGQQEESVLLTSFTDMLHCAQNWARSRSIWPFMFAFACCGFEMIVAASAPLSTTWLAVARRGARPARRSPLSCPHVAPRRSPPAHESRR